MSIKQNPIWLVALLIATLTFTACVRPVPQEEPTAVPENDPGAVPTQPGEQPDQSLPIPIDESLPEATPIPEQPTAETVPTVEQAQDTIHTVQAGDTLFIIASQYGVTIDVIIAANDIPNINQLELGQQILIPAPGSVVPASPTEVIAGETPLPTVATPIPTQGPPANDGTHVVQSGENLYRIGIQYGCSVDQMATANGIANVSQISVGQILQIPDCN